MLATQSVIDALANRIEWAYRLRRPDWRGCHSTPRVWAAAASALCRAHDDDPSVPIDPELFVASQPLATNYPDPWRDLTPPSALSAYRVRVRAIVRALRKELSGEVRLAERQIASGESIARVVSARSRKLSALGRYIVAQRAGRPALAKRFLREAADQHLACPLYREACASLLPAGSYPIPDGHSPVPSPTTKSRPRHQVHLN